jgi:hypothetical protein
MTTQNLFICFEKISTISARSDSGGRFTSLAATVKEQAAQIQKVSAQLEVNKLPRKSFSTISKAAEPITQPNLAISGHASPRAGLFVSPRSPLFKIARLLVRLDHVASFIKYANHSVM